MMKESFDVRLNKFTADINKRGVARPCTFACIIHLPALLTPRLGRQLWVGGTASVMALRIDQASLPSRSLMTVDQRFHGPVRRIPYAAMYSTMQLQVLLSENMFEREILMSWQDMALSGGGHTSVRNANYQAHATAPFDASYYNEVVGTVEILQFPESPSLQGAAASQKSFLDTLIGTAQAVGFDPSQLTSPFGINLGLGGERSRPIRPSYRARLIEAYPQTIQEVQLNWNSTDIAHLNVEMQFHHVEEEHDASQSASAYGFEKFLRDGVNTLNKFTPILSLFRNQGVKGGVSAALNSAGAGARNNVTSGLTGIFGAR